MPLYRLHPDHYLFPDPDLAEDDGLLAIGGDLSPQRLLVAYGMGIFPWYNPEDPILWWSPDPRLVLFPEEVKISHSMRPLFNRAAYRVTFDRNFDTIIRKCRFNKRKHQQGTWISDDIIDAYTALHRMGFAHSVEVWQEDEIVGGLYGISTGKCFFGESMFAEASNASKFGLITLCQKLRARNFFLIDCQQETLHLTSMGARCIPRTEFLDILEKSRMEESLTGDWGSLLG
jgi:leucyl/phenylalanyl-tRNA--protein transferase